MYVCLFTPQALFDNSSNNTYSTNGGLHLDISNKKILDTTLTLFGAGEGGDGFYKV